MNSKGQKFLTDVNKKCQGIKIDLPWGCSRVQERIMRLGREARAFEVQLSSKPYPQNMEYNEDLYLLAVATIKLDIYEETLATA